MASIILPARTRTLVGRRNGPTGSRSSQQQHQLYAETLSPGHFPKVLRWIKAFGNPSRTRYNPDHTNSWEGRKRWWAASAPPRFARCLVLATRAWWRVPPTRHACRITSMVKLRQHAHHPICNRASWWWSAGRRIRSTTCPAVTYALRLVWNRQTRCLHTRWVN